MIQKPLLFVLLVYIVLITACPNAGTMSLMQSVKLTEQDILTAFSLKKGEITASDAAKKVQSGVFTNTAHLVFTEKTYTAYDDKAGTFSIRVKGTKNGAAFEQDIMITGFTHPYENTLLGTIEYHEGSRLLFDKAIEKNLALVPFINEANAAEGIGYTFFRYDLSGNDKKVEVGKHSAYNLTAILREENGKANITAKYSLNYRSYSGGAERIAAVPIFEKSAAEQESYFTRDDVFKYILNKVKHVPDFINTKETFASEYYARAVTSDKTPDRLFNKAILKKYQDLYQTKDTGEHLELPNIDAALLYPRNNGIKADDYAGTLEVTYYIATKDLIEHIGSNGFIPVTDTKKTDGFYKVDDNTIKDLFFFGLTKKTGNAADWDKASISNTFLVRETGTAGDNNWLSPISYSDQVIVSGYTLSLNGSADFVGDKYLADRAQSFLSKALNGKLILIKSMEMSKPAGQRALTIRIIFEGSKNGIAGEPIMLTASPIQ